MKILHLFFLVICIYDVAYASMANSLADRVLKKVSNWLNSDGTGWLTLPAGYKNGQVQPTGGRFLLAFSNPRLEKVETIARTGEAELNDADPDPAYGTSQTLKFVSSFRNVTINYDQVSYNENYCESYNLTAQATTNGVTAGIVVDLKGHGDSCMAFADSIDVTYNGSLEVTVSELTTGRYAVPVEEAVRANFKNNVPKAFETLLETAIFESLKFYDICTGVNYPQIPPNVFANSMINSTSYALSRHISEWATLPTFWKNTLVNDTTLAVIQVVNPGNFCSFGKITRIGAASYENHVDPKLMNLNLSFEVDSLTGVYGTIEYIDYNIWYSIAETITSDKIRTNLTITFTRETVHSVPSCVDAAFSVDSKYSPSGRDLNISNLTKGIPHYVLRTVNKVLGPEFLSFIEGAATDLFKNATKFALKELCG